MHTLAATFACLAVLCSAGPALAQTYHPNPALGELLSKTLYIVQPTNPGGKNILDNSCIYKDSFSLSPSKPVLEQCDAARGTAEFVAKYGRPDATAPAPGDKTLLEYFLLFNDNSYHVKMFVGCADGKTETFAMVECKVEKNRAKPGPPKDKKPFWKQISPF
ncbi:hypothetical protein [Solidesulfovibrio sp.]|uniref:hypothetical protein n=1 Tax=Solidesulfovibrio sp. TaxID=2910990 RepID=UPI0026139112|nr:hypothetical protein [Solidesulfovibrio sp.]